MRRLLWLAGLPLRLLLLGLIAAYRRWVGSALGARCRFHPSCSAYAAEAIRSRGAMAGSAFAIWRVLRCSPLSAGGPDPAPSPRTLVYDRVVPEGLAEVR